MTEIKSDYIVKTHHVDGHQLVRHVIQKLSPGKRAEIHVSKSSLFYQNTWDFSTEFPNTHREYAQIKFELSLDDGESLTNGRYEQLLDSMKCLAYSLIYDPPNGSLSLRGFTKIFSIGHGIGNLYFYLAKNKFRSVSELTEYDFSEFLNYFKKLPVKRGKGHVISDRTLVGRLRGVEWLYLQRNKLADKLIFDPWSEEGTVGRWAMKNSQANVSRDMLQTEAWSDKLIAAMINSAIREVEKKNELCEKFEIRSVLSEIKSNLGNKKYYRIYGAEVSAECSTLKRDYALFRSSVFLLVGILTGMRSSELRSIRGTSSDICEVREELLSNRYVIGYFILSHLIKHQPIPKQEKWQTIPFAHKVINLLIDINKFVENQRVDYLFRICDRPKEKTARSSLASNTLVLGMNDLAKRYQVDLTEVNGRISAMNLRRTFARVVTRGGLGIVELQSQLKHEDPELTFKYGAPSLREYLAEEKMNWSRDQYAELLGANDSIIGGGASDLLDLRNQFVGLTREGREVFLDALPKKALIDQVGDGLCMYRPDRALCGGEKVSCRPAECTNSIMRVDDVLNTLRYRKKENERLLKRFARQPGKRAHLKEQIATVTKLLDQAKVIDKAVR